MERKARHDPPARLSRDIAVALAAKLVALALLYALFFGPTQRVTLDAASIEARLTGVLQSGVKR
ncbi:MAG TPA: hypothetical protein VHT04_08290 [Stellaceae bacterium]|nr:hypothetical protein [Stellaceae bacterium]